MEKSRISKFPSLIFLCGGPFKNNDNEFKSCREIFFRHIHETQKFEFRKNVILAEDIFNYFSHSSYTDLITFEEDIAELAALTVIFSESPGAIAELGTFAVLKQVQERLLVIINEEDAEQESFIWRGPALYLKNKAKENDKDDPISIYKWPKLKSDNDLLRKSDFSDADDLSELIQKVLDETPKTSSFNKDHAGHLMLLIVDLLNILKLATIEEIHEILNSLGIECKYKTIQQKLSLLCSLKYVRKKPYGHNVFYLANIDDLWLSLAFKKTAKTNDLYRWRAMFADYYNEENKQKSRALRSFMTANKSNGNQI
ncbi:MAG: retron St85 family effector protein [Smithella sp.]